MGNIFMYCAVCEADTERPSVTIVNDSNGLRFNGKCGSCGN